MDVELYADPSCPWSWATYMWLDRVSARRQLRLVLRPFSLALRDGIRQLSETKQRAREDALRALRVAALLENDATRWAYFAAVTAPAYTSLAAGQLPAFDATAAAAKVGVGARTASRADDPTVDDLIRGWMRSAAEDIACEGAAEPQRIPLVVLGGRQRRTAFIGPLLDPVPTGEAAVRLWDALEALGRLPGVYEISRPRPASHSLVQAPRWA